jgi:hypothetical protein
MKQVIGYEGVASRPIAMNWGAAAILDDGFLYNSCTQGQRHQEGLKQFKKYVRDKSITELPTPIDLPGSEIAQGDPWVNMPIFVLDIASELTTREPYLLMLKDPFVAGRLVGKERSYFLYRSFKSLQQWSMSLLCSQFQLVPWSPAKL